MHLLSPARLRPDSPGPAPFRRPSGASTPSPLPMELGQEDAVGFPPGGVLQVAVGQVMVADAPPAARRPRTGPRRYRSYGC